jgi:DNA-binding transcriptional regulator YiaG
LSAQGRGHVIDAYLMLAVVAAIVGGAIAAALRLARNSVRERRELSSAAHRSVAEYYARTLRQAAEVAGGEAELAARLGVAPETLRRWLDGAETPPMEIHLAALDLVTRGAPQAEAE